MRPNTNTLFTFLSVILFSFLLTACGGGGGGGGGSQTTTQQGVFLDAIVQGVSYTSGSISGTTDANGNFTYEPGKSITFKIGDIVLGTATAAPIITPISLAGASSENDPTVINMVRFLLIIDDDGNPSNGIQVSDAVKAAAAAQQVNFKMSTTGFATDFGVINALAEMTAKSTVGARSFADVSVADAQAHFGDTIIGMMTSLAGDYSGTFSGGNSGTWQITVDQSGNITGGGNSTVTGLDFTVTGDVSSNGQGGFGFGGTASFEGYFSLDGCFAGSWYDSTTGDKGVYSGSKNGSSPSDCSKIVGEVDLSTGNPGGGGSGGTTIGGTVGGQVNLSGQIPELGSALVPVDQMIVDTGSLWFLSLGTQSLSSPPGSEPPLVIGFVFNNLGVATLVSVNKGTTADTTYYEYTLDCTSNTFGCQSVFYNASAGTVSMTNAVLTPTSSSGNLATGNLTLNGSVSFTKN